MGSGGRGADICMCDRIVVAIVVFLVSSAVSALLAVWGGMGWGWVVVVLLGCGGGGGLGFKDSGIQGFIQTPGVGWDLRIQGFKDSDPRGGLRFRNSRIQTPGVG